MVFAALTTIEGIRGWWSPKAHGGADECEPFMFRRNQLEVIEAGPDPVRWLYSGPATGWVGIEIVFRLEWREIQTVVLFSHRGWREPVEFMHHCSTKRATFLPSLVMPRSPWVPEHRRSGQGFHRQLHGDAHRVAASHEAAGVDAAGGVAHGAVQGCALCGHLAVQGQQFGTGAWDLDWGAARLHAALVQAAGAGADDGVGQAVVAGEGFDAFHQVFAADEAGQDQHLRISMGRVAAG